MNFYEINILYNIYELAEYLYLVKLSCQTAYDDEHTDVMIDT